MKVFESKSSLESIVKGCSVTIGNFDGVIQRYNKPFTKTGHDALNIKDFFMAKFDKDGNIAPIKE